MTQFSVSDSGMFSAGHYDEATRTLTVQFRSGDKQYTIDDVAPELGKEFMTASSKSAVWHRSLSDKARGR